MMQCVPCRIFSALVLAASLAACSGSDGSDSALAKEAPKAGNQLFTLLPSSFTGVTFENKLTDTPELNIFTYRNYYNGGGVAIGDLNNDGRPEVVLVSNQGGPKIYLNRGNFHFSDITRATGIE